ncbi:glycosyltransferase family 2 protein [Halorussus amylolyticus]|uniref:glycosyltransferase family 2 protein n=1 Tax=Halorussus amylolyticus TaxID=1126242 RepID=UPI00104E2355|nr:glycosyltransferase family 2 protein [Halorussus amylolyticus]
MSSDGLVSVVIPTYYRNDRLRAALESVEAQEYDPIEVVVVDSSDDGHARPVAESFEGAEYRLTERDEGPQAARSLGAERASGEYVQFLDDDDRLAPSKLREQVALLDSPVGVAYSGMIDELRGEILPNPAVRGDVLEYALEMRTFPCINSTMLIDADVLAEMLPLRHRHGADDTGLKIELAMHTEFDFVNEPLVFRGRTDTSLSESWAYLDGRKQVLRTFADVYRSFPPRVRRRAVRETHYQAARKHLEERGWSPRATVEFARAAYYTPDDRADYVGECLASVFGRPGVRAADRILS